MRKFRIRPDNVIVNYPDYDEEVFRKVLLLRGRDNWDIINAFMGHEYRMKWAHFLRTGKCYHARRRRTT